MASSEIRAFACPIPAGTPASAPLVTPTTFPDRVVNRIEIVVPAGPAGDVGFAIGARSQQIFPYVAGTWIITDDEKIGWDVVNQPTTGDWSVIAYNTGTRTHTLYVRFLVTVPPPAPTLLIPSSALSSGA